MTRHVDTVHVKTPLKDSHATVQPITRDKLVIYVCWNFYWSTESLRSLINTCILSDYGYRGLLKYNKANFSDSSLLDNFLFNRKHVVVDFQWKSRQIFGRVNKMTITTFRELVYRALGSGEEEAKYYLFSIWWKLMM